MRTLLFAALVVALAPLAALADDEGGVKITEADWAAFKKGAYADALADARASTRAGAHQVTDADRADYKKALADAKWTQERYDEVRSELTNIAMMIADAAGGDDGAKENLASKEKVTLATVKAHLDEVRAEPWRKKAEEAAKGEADDLKTGRAPTAAELVGTWVFDIEPTIKGFADMLGAEGAEKMRPTLPKKATITIQAGSPGAIEQMTEQPGQPVRTEKGTWRIEGKKLFILQGKRESHLDVGMKSGQLLLSIFGTAMVYKKK